MNPAVFAVKNGYVEVLDGRPSRSPLCFSMKVLIEIVGPGLGVEINEALVREAAAKHSTEKAWRNAVWKGEDGSLREW